MTPLSAKYVARGRFIALILILTAASCAPRARGIFGQGMVDASGRRQGEWIVYHRPTTVVLGSGRFVNGVPEGPWTIYDTRGVKVAELVYAAGCVDGPYRLWYGHKYDATFVKTYGNGKHCKLDGNFERYLPDGNLLVRYTAGDGVVTSVQYGSWGAAEEQLQADKDLLAMYLSFIMRVE